MSAAERVLDCLGQACPIPVIELARAMQDLQIGDVVTVLSDDPAAGPDIAAWCRMRAQGFEAGPPPAYRVTRLS